MPGVIVGPGAPDGPGPEKVKIDPPKGPGPKGPGPGGVKGKDPGPGKGPAGTPKSVNNRARLVVELPEDARLYVDDILTKSTSSRRVFITPPLQNGNTYYYILRAVMERDGRPVQVTGRVVIRPGQEISASLRDPNANGAFVVRVNEQ